MAKKKADKNMETKKKGTKQPADKIGKKSKPETPTYKGIFGKLSKKQKEAIDAVEATFRSALKLNEQASVKINGEYRRCQRVADEKGRQFDTWHLGCIEVHDAEPNSGVGRFWMNSDVEAGNVLLAANLMLYSYGSKPKKISDDEVIDEFAEAKGRLEYALTLPNPSRMLNLLYYALWAEKKLKDISLKDFLATRPEGFYGITVKEQAIPLVDSLGVDGRGRMDERLAAAKAVKPYHVFQVVLKGHDAKNYHSHHLLKHVAAHPSAFTKWLSVNKMIDHLDRAPTDLVTTCDNEREQEKIMRSALTMPRSHGGVDVILDYNKDTDTFTYKYRGVQEMTQNLDPVFDWPEQSKKFLAEERDRQDTKYRNSSAYQRVEEEMAGTGESVYKGRTIKPHAGSGYTLTGNDRFEDLLEVMHFIDSDDANPSISVAAAPKPAKPKEKKPKAAPVAEQPAPEETAPPVQAVTPEEQAIATPKEESTEVGQSIPWPERPSLEELLEREDIPWDRVKAFFAQNTGSMAEDKEVEVISKHLLSEYQKGTLEDMKLSVPMVLNGRYEEAQAEEVKKILADWNERLGAKVFSTPGA